MPRFKNSIFLLNSPKIKLFLQKKCKIFERWGLRPQTPKLVPHRKFLATRLVEEEKVLIISSLETTSNEFALFSICILVLSAEFWSFYFEILLPIETE